MKKLITAIILTLATPSVAQSILNTFFPGTSDGVTYHLPDTKINITVEASCVTQTPGEFYSYAERFLHIKNAITEASTSTKVIFTNSAGWISTGRKGNFSQLKLPVPWSMPNGVSSSKIIRTLKTVSQLRCSHKMPTSKDDTSTYTTAPIPIAAICTYTYRSIPV